MTETQIPTKETKLLFIDICTSVTESFYVQPPIHLSKHLYVTLSVNYNTFFMLNSLILFQVQGSV